MSFIYIQVVFSYLSIMLFSYLLSAVYHIIICKYCLYARTLLLFTHAHWVAFWQPWICKSRYWTLSYIVQVFVEAVCFARSWSFSLLVPVFLSLLPSCYFLILDIYQIQFLFQFFIYVISSANIYMSYCSDIDYRSRFFYSLFRLL